MKKALKSLSLLLAGSLSLVLTSCGSQFPYVKALEERTARQCEKPEKKYAVIVANKGEEFETQALNAYECLRKMGYTDEGITLLAAEDKYRSVSRKCDEKRAPCSIEGLIDHEASSGNLREILNELSGKVTDKDKFFFLFTGHGVEEEFRSLSFRSRRGITKDSMTVIELKEYLAKVKAKQGILVFSTCKAGEFARLTAEGNYVAIASSRGDESDNVASNFPSMLAYALAGEDADGSKVDADYNHDRMVSVEEAFYYAAMNNDLSYQEGHIIRQFCPKPEIYSDKLKPSEVFLRCEAE